jgi:RNA polymerase-binding transcription factor DksA
LFSLDDIDFQHFKELLQKHSPSGNSEKSQNVHHLDKEKLAFEEFCCADQLNSSDEENDKSNVTPKKDKKNQKVDMKSVEQLSTKYHLVCVVHHLGQFATSGHYISDIQEYFDFMETENKATSNQKENIKNIASESNTIHQNRRTSSDWKTYDDMRVSDVCDIHYYYLIEQTTTTKHF